MRTIILCLCAVSLLAAQNPNLGSSGAKFLNVPVGARAASMAGAVIGTTNDAASVFWNPAGITGVTGTSVHFSAVDLYAQYNASAASIVQNFGDLGVLAASFTSVSMEKTEITTELKPEGTGRYYDAQDLAIGLTYARALSNEFLIGVTGKYINQRIWNEVAEGFAFDIGTQYRIDFNNLVIAMSMTNFGGDLQFDGEDLNITKLRDNNYPISRLAPGRLETSEFALPLHFQVGVAMDVVKTDFVTMRGEIDATHPNDYDERINIGTELQFVERLFLRGGYRVNYDDETFTLGGGFNVQMGNSIVRFDYAFANFELLPDLHRYSVEIDF
ncbi:MAG: PorV/PorQ family protein [Bacteroidetes bacterium]|nr:PorV/PorQ family protein [Bacteroidota bacterium]